MVGSEAGGLSHGGHSPGPASGEAGMRQSGLRIVLQRETRRHQVTRDQLGEPLRQRHQLTTDSRVQGCGVDVVRKVGPIDVRRPT
jgi:hypothetical protein